MKIKSLLLTSTLVAFSLAFLPLNARAETRQECFDRCAEEFLECLGNCLNDAALGAVTGCVGGAVFGIGTGPGVLGTCLAAGVIGAGIEGFPCAYDCGTASVDCLNGCPPE